MEKEGLKYDSGKLRYDLLPTIEIEKLVDILSFGAKKYGDWNWINLENAEDRYFAALLRHLFAYRNGEHLDPESGRHHLSHVMCNAVFLSHIVDKPIK